MSLEREGFWRGKKKAKRKSNLRINSKEGKQTFPQTNKITANEKISLLRLKSNHRKDFIVTRRNMIATRERRGLSASWLPCGCMGLERAGEMLSGREGIKHNPCPKLSQRDSCGCCRCKYPGSIALGRSIHIPCGTLWDCSSTPAPTRASLGPLEMPLVVPQLCLHFTLI